MDSYECCPIVACIITSLGSIVALMIAVGGTCQYSSNMEIY
jgi:hypothetical protein